MENNQLELIVGKNLARILLEDNADYLIKSIKKLREEREYTIPLVHITDELKADKNCYEIKQFDKSILKQPIGKNIEKDVLVEEIIKNIDNICKI